MAWVVDVQADLVGRQGGAGVGAQQFSRLGRRRGIGIEPTGEILGVQNHRHAMVNRRQRGVGLGGDDGAAFDRAVRARPALPQAGEGERRPVGAGDPIGLLAPVFAAPFVESVGRDQAAATYRAYLEREPGDAEAWKTLGIVESDRREPDAAYAAFEKAAAIGGDDPVDVYFNWAITAARANDLERVEACIEEMEASDPEGWRTLLTKADYEEAQEQVWPAWEILCEAFDAVLEDKEDLGTFGYVAAGLIRFATRHDMSVHVGEYVERIFEEGLYSEDVLRAFQSLDGLLSNAVKSHQVVLKAAPVDDEDEPDGGRFVVYGVSAEDAAEAGELALEFEAKYGPCAWEVHSLQQITGPDEGHVGIYWRSEEMDRPPAAR